VINKDLAKEMIKHFERVSDDDDELTIHDDDQFIMLFDGRLMKYIAIYNIRNGPDGSEVKIMESKAITNIRHVQTFDEEKLHALVRAACISENEHIIRRKQLFGAFSNCMAEMSKTDDVDKVKLSLYYLDPASNEIW